MKKDFKLAYVGAFLLALHLCVILAGFFAPYGYEIQDREHPYASPALLHLEDCSGSFHLRPFAYGKKPVEGSFNQYEDDCAQMMPLQLLPQGDRYSIFGLQLTHHLFGVAGPERLHVLGTDGFGRDQLSRLIYGAQVSLFAGLLAAVLAVFTGMLLGTFAGISGGAIDDGAMRFAEIIMAVPPFYVLLAVRAMLPLHMAALSAFFLVVSVFGLLFWGRPARLIRGVVLSTRERNFVLAARGFGAGRWYLMRRHLMPETFAVALTQIAVLAPQFVLAEVLLSFLGLGIGEPFPSWGNMLATAQQYHVLLSYWWMLLPGLAPVPVFLGYHLLADALQERLKPKA